jgi:outer membrane protein assembly factor BamB
MQFHYAATFAILLAALPPLAHADDWPQWMGPQRDNVWREDGLLEDFPDVTADNVKTDNFDRNASSGTERVFCLHAETGKEIWRHEYPVKYTISYPAGPRCTPNVDGDRVYTLGAEGNLICFNRDNGKVLWQKDLPKEYNTKTAMWGYSSHPLIDGDKLIVLAGGTGTHAVALNKNTGKEIWRALTSPEQGYSPPTIIEAAGRRQLILARVNAFTSVDPETGSEYWSVPYEATSGSVIMSPVRYENHLYIGGYNMQTLMVQLNDNEPTADILWRNKNDHGLSPVNVQPHVSGDTMYGFDQNGRLYALELPSGRRLWDTTKPVSDRPVYSGTAFIVKQGDAGTRYWLFNERGDLIIANLTPEGYQEIDRANTLIAPTNNAFNRDVVWCMPAFANRRMYVRNDEQIICVDLAR